MEVEELAEAVRRINVGARGRVTPSHVNAATAVMVDDALLVVLDVAAVDSAVPISTWWSTRPGEHDPAMWTPDRIAGLVSLMLDELIDTGGLLRTDAMEIRDGRHWVNLEEPGRRLGAC